MIHISASLLAADFACLRDDIIRLETAGVDSFHLDFMDGHYVRNLAFTPQHIRAIEPLTRLPIHVHLELSNPGEILQSCEGLNVEYYIVQSDTLGSPEELFGQIRSMNSAIGLGVSPTIELSLVEPWLSEIELLLILSVPPGFGGQAMIPDALERMQQAHEMINRTGREIHLAMDGGVKFSNAREFFPYGVDHFVMGSGLFGIEDLPTAIADLRA